MADSGRFDKDFGYLLPFFDRVAGAAAELADPQARAELARLMSEEKQRWARIRELLAGAKGAPEASAAARPAPLLPATRTDRAPASEPLPEVLRLTVGSLRKG